MISRWNVFFNVILIQIIMLFVTEAKEGLHLVRYLSFAVIDVLLLIYALIGYRKSKEK